MDHFEEFEGHEPLGLPFDEEAGFFHPEEAHEGEDFAAAHPVEESVEREGRAATSGTDANRGRRGEAA